MKKVKKWLVPIILGTAFLFILYCLWSKTKNPGESIEKIDSLDSKIDSIYIIKDSLFKEIDTVYVELENNNIQYEKDFNHIINNNVNEDYMFFLNYINSNRERLDSIGKNF